MFTWRSLTVACHPIFGLVRDRDVRGANWSLSCYSLQRGVVSFSLSLDSSSKYIWCKRDLFLKGLHDEEVGSARSEASSRTCRSAVNRDPLPMMLDDAWWIKRPRPANRLAEVGCTSKLFLEYIHTIQDVQQVLEFGLDGDPFPLFLLTFSTRHTHLMGKRQPSSPQKASLPSNDGGLCRSHPAGVPKKGRGCVSRNR